MTIICRLLVSTCLMLISYSIVCASSMPRYPEDDWKALSIILRDKTLPVTWKDGHGHSIVSLHMQYGSEETAVQYLKNASLHELEIIKAEDLLANAAGHGSQRIVRTLLDRGISPNPKIMPLSTALMAAASSGHLEIMRMLLQAKADVKARTEYGRDALFVALEEGKFHSVNLLLDNGVSLEPYKKKADNGELLFTAIQGKSEYVVKLLLQNGLNPNAFDRFGDTPLVHAIRLGAGMYIISVLFNSGADECLRTKDGKLPREVVADLKEIEEPWKREYVEYFKKECPKK